MKAKASSWNSVDWTKRDIDLASELGVSRERVRQVRKQRGISRSIYHRRSSQYLLCRKEIHGIQSDVPLMTMPELSEKLRCSTPLIRRLLAEFGLKSMRSKRRIPWEVLDFRLPSMILAEIWGVHWVRVFEYRREHGMRRPLIDRRCDQKVPAELVEHQRSLAKIFFAHNEMRRRKIIRYFANPVNQKEQT